jgi:uncharacterized protein (TIGR01777 family)
MKILITGATGLVGTELVNLLLRKGVQVNFLTISQNKITKKPNLQGFFWNPEQGIIDENAFIGVDAIIHLAGANVSKRWTNTYKQEIIESRIISSNLLFKVLKHNPNQVKQIISASAIGVYPDSLKNIYTETNKNIDDSFLGNVVVKWEESVDKFKLLNIKVCKLRTGIVLSEKGGALFEMLKPIKFGLGAAFGTGKQIQSWIHLTDLTEMYLFAAQNQLEGIYNAVAPNPISNKQLTVAIAKKLKKPLFLPNIPEFIMQMVLGEMHEILFSSQNVNNHKIINEGFSFKYTSVEKALEHLL